MVGVGVVGVGVAGTGTVTPTIVVAITVTATPTIDAVALAFGSRKSNLERSAGRTSHKGTSCSRGCYCIRVWHLAPPCYSPNEFGKPCTPKAGLFF